MEGFREKGSAPHTRPKGVCKMLVKLVSQLVDKLRHVIDEAL
jgi:hypothetical protein